MPEPIKPEYQRYIPTGIVDSLDGNTSKQGAMTSLANLMPSPDTLGYYIARPAAFTYTSFPGITSAGYVSVGKEIDSFIVGMIASSLNPGFDQPFVYDTVSGSFLTITGITSANVPTSPATSGAWTPPTVDQIGKIIVFTHPGFNTTNGYFGWLDFTGASITSLTGDVNAVTNPTFITNLNVDPSTVGVTVGMTISGLGIATGATVVYFNATTIIMSLPASGTGSATPLTLSGGTASSPLWASGNTNTNPLPSVPLAVANFSDRAYFACVNYLFYSDVLNPLNMATATQFLVLGGTDPITALAPQPFYTSQQGGIAAALLAFKEKPIWQITGDAALNTLIENKLSDSAGTGAPRSLASTPLGVMYMANDGIRTVDLTGKISPPNRDKKDPFLAVVVPSRVAAAYNTGTYRISIQYLQGGVSQKSDFWFDTDDNIWSGPHSITYDLILSTGNTFLLGEEPYAGTLLQSNVLPGPLDFFTELGSNLTFDYHTVTLPEFRPISGWSITESAIFMGFDAQQNIVANILDQSSNVLSTFTLTTPFYAPSKAANWKLAFDPNPTPIPSRHSFQITGMSSSGVGIGSLGVHYQVQSNANSLDLASPDYLPSSFDFGLVTDPIINYNMDWGSVADSILYSVDFEVVGPLTGPP